MNEKGDQIYRMKGVLALSVGEGMTEQLVYQGVHQQYSGELMGLLGSAWFLWAAPQVEMRQE